MGSSTGHRRFWQLVERQEAVVTHAQLVALGYSARAIQHRIDRGRLHRVHRGVYAVGRPDLTQRGRWMAALLACGADSALSHDSAAAALGLARDLPPEPVHVSSLGRSRSREGLVVHRRMELLATTHRGIRVTTPAQTLIDLAATWAQNRVEAAIAEADLRGVVSIRKLMRAARDGGRKGAALRAIIEPATFRVTQSELERAFLRLVVRAGLPLPETQRRFGRTRADFFWPEIGLVVETDGAGTHRTAIQQTRDRRRDQAHQRAGRTPLRLTHWQVFREPEQTIALLIEVFARLARQRD